ncbi:MAG TPA: type II secretion system protein [Nitrospira sp.]|nr:type II secretion system protein [Nitrospira sp.]
MNRDSHQEGMTLIEVIVAMVIAGIVLLGAIGAVQVSSVSIRDSGLATKALELAQSRLESKRSVLWQLLLEDDVDGDGMPDTLMKDDGQDGDVAAADGIYTAMLERDGVMVVWTVETDSQRPLHSAGLVAIEARSSYIGRGGRTEVRVATLRANPVFVGPQ